MRPGFADGSAEMGREFFGRGGAVCGNAEPFGDGDAAVASGSNRPLVLASSEMIASSGNSAPMTAAQLSDPAARLVVLASWTGLRHRRSGGTEAVCDFLQPVLMGMILPSTVL